MRLKELRKKAGLSQKRLAEIFNVAQNTISQWELGLRTMDIDTASKLADFFNVSVDYFLGRTDDPLGKVDLEPDIRMISRAAQKMDPEKRNKMLRLLKITFEEEFKDE